MGRAIARVVVTATLGLAVAGVGLVGCSSHHSTLPKSPAAVGSPTSTTAAQAGGGGATNAANGTSGSAGAATPTVLGGGTGCSLLSASDVTNAAGMPLPSMLGNVNGGLEGNTGHNGCLYTKDETGRGTDVSVEVNTFASGVSDQLATLRKNDQDQVDNVNSQAANSAVLKDAAVGDGGFEDDYTAGPDESVWFTKGSKLINVEVNKGTPGAALTLAKIVAGKE